MGILSFGNPTRRWGAPDRSPLSVEVFAGTINAVRLDDPLEYARFLGAGRRHGPSLVHFPSSGVILGHVGGRIDLISVVVGPGGPDHGMESYAGVVRADGHEIPIEGDVEESAILALLGEPADRVGEDDSALCYEREGVEVEFEFDERGRLAIISMMMVEDPV